MDFNFDWNYVAAGAPYITINETSLAFNTPAISLLQNAPNVVVGFDKEKMAIGVMNAQNHPDGKSYAFYTRIRQGWIRIGCKDFIKHLSAISGISFTPAKKYLAQYDEEGQVLYILINDKEVNKIEENSESE